MSALTSTIHATLAAVEALPVATARAAVLAAAVGRPIPDAADLEPLTREDGEILADALGFEAPWFVGQCYTCNRHLGQPFRSADDRDQWAIQHSERTGHPVSIYVDLDSLTDAGSDVNAAILRHTASHIRRNPSGWFYRCSDVACRSVGQWFGPHASGQVAFAALAEHLRTAE